MTNRRLLSQGLATPKFESATDVVAHFGAMQGQDYAMAKWAVGCRMLHATDDLIENAIDEGKIIRTHLMRPTWHFVAAQDLHWMLALTSENIMRQLRSSYTMLGLDEKMLHKSNDKIYQALQQTKHLTRDELMEVLQSAGVKTNETRSSHYLMHAEMAGIICSGKRNKQRHTYTLLDNWVKKEKHFTREEALAELAKRYFASHSPTTLKDFSWWSGLSVGDSKLAIAMNAHLIKAEWNSQIYYLANSEKVVDNETESVRLLPAFDEFLIAYKDRSASIHKDHHRHAFTTNGIFRPIVVVNGQVVGTWKRLVKKEKLHIEISLIDRSATVNRDNITAEAIRYGNFMQKDTEIIF